MARPKKETTSVEEKKVVKTIVADKTPVETLVEEPAEPVTVESPQKLDVQESEVVEDISEFVVEGVCAEDISEIVVDKKESVNLTRNVVNNNVVGAYVAQKLTDDKDGAPVSASHFDDENVRQGVIACNLSNI